MSINLSVPSNNDTPELKPRITVIGVGGAGGNAVNNMITSELEGVDFVVVNTDAQALAQSRTDRRVQIGGGVTQGLGSGARPEIGCAAAEESLQEVLDEINGSNMIFIAAGMGGGTGTGAAPVIAQAAREQGILTVGVVTKPFHFEGTHRMTIAEAGVEEMGKYVDTLIIIPNQNLFRIANEKTTFADAFKMADDVLYSGVRGVTDLMVMPGMINLDFADIRSVMGGMGKAMMGTGDAEGERRALDAAEEALSNPLLDDTSMKGAKGVLINITGGSDMTLFEVDEAANKIREEVDPSACINFGSTFDDTMEGRIRVSVVATGMDSESAIMQAPTLLNLAQAAGETMASDQEAYEEDNDDVTEQQPTAAIVEMPEITDENKTPDHDGDEIVIEDSVSDDGASQTSDEVETLIPAFGGDTGTPPPATPMIGAGEAFIPSAAIGLAGKPISRVADPFADAAMSNGAGKLVGKFGKKTEKAKPTLFERVTGMGRAAKTPNNAANVADVQDVVDEQKQLGGMDPNDRIVDAQVDEDLLDIPAFLRRQAN